MRDRNLTAGRGSTARCRWWPVDGAARWWPVGNALEKAPAAHPARVRPIHMSNDNEHIRQQMTEMVRGRHEALMPAYQQENLMRGTLLRVMAGFEPKPPDLHLGHT